MTLLEAAACGRAAGRHRRPRMPRNRASRAQCAAGAAGRPAGAGRRDRRLAARPAIYGQRFAAAGRRLVEREFSSARSGGSVVDPIDRLLGRVARQPAMPPAAASAKARLRPIQQAGPHSSVLAPLRQTGPAVQTIALQGASGRSSSCRTDARSPSSASAMSACRSRSPLRGTARRSIGFDIDAKRIAELARRPRPHARGRAAPTCATRRLRFTSDAGRARGGRLLHRHRADADRRGAAARSHARCSAPRETVGGRSSSGDIVVYELTVYPGATEEDCVPVLEQASGPEGRHATSRSAIRPSASIRATRRIASRPSSRSWPGQDARTLDIVADGLRLGRHRRHSSRAVDQGRRSRQGHREHAARSQHRAHERAVGDLPSARHRHRRRAGGGGDQMEFPAFTPGLVGGHCIGVDPYYLTHRARRPAIIPR